MTGVEDLRKQVEVLRKFVIWPVLKNLARVDEFCPAIVEIYIPTITMAQKIINYKQYSLKSFSLAGCTFN